MRYSLVYAKMWNHKHHFYLDIVSREVFCKKEKFILSLVDLEKVSNPLPRDVV